VVLCFHKCQRFLNLLGGVFFMMIGQSFQIWSNFPIHSFFKVARVHLPMIIADCFTCLVYLTAFNEATRFRQVGSSEPVMHIYISHKSHNLLFLPAFPRCQIGIHQCLFHVQNWPLYLSKFDVLYYADLHSILFFNFSFGPTPFPLETHFFQYLLIVQLKLILSWNTGRSFFTGR
jgi:hypothetical protein